MNNVINKIAEVYFSSRNFFNNITLKELRNINALQAVKVIKYITGKGLKESKFIYDFGKKLDALTLNSIKYIDIVIIENSNREKDLKNLIKDYISVDVLPNGFYGQKPNTFIIVKTDITLNTKNVNIDFVQIVNTTI